MSSPLLKSKMFWVSVLYFSEGFPLGIFYELFPVYFRQQKVELWKIGFMSLLGLSWTLKFLWAPAVDRYRHHRRWMFVSDLLMGIVIFIFPFHPGFGIWAWVTIGAFTLLSATNDIAIDGFTIELLKKEEMGLANGLRIGFYRVGMLAAGFVLILTDYIQWSGAYLAAAAILFFSGILCLNAPDEKEIATRESLSLLCEMKALARRPFALIAVLLFLLGALWLIDNVTKWSETYAHFWLIVFLISGTLAGVSALLRGSSVASEKARITEGPMFGTLMQMLKRPHFAPIIIFILIFKLADSAMGFMIKPFWVDSGLTATEIGLVSVNVGLLLSISGGIVGGWFTDRAGIFPALWILGLFQAVSNLGYAYAAWIVPKATSVLLDHKLLIYAASAIESFTGGLGTAAFLAFLMAIVDKRRSATEYALLSSVFALSRSLAGWASGFGAQQFGYAPYFLLTFFLAAPAYFLLPWVKKMLLYAESQPDWGQK